MRRDYAHTVGFTGKASVRVEERGQTRLVCSSTSGVFCLRVPSVFWPLVPRFSLLLLSTVRCRAFLVALLLLIYQLALNPPHSLARTTRLLQFPRAFDRHAGSNWGQTQSCLAYSIGGVFSAGTDIPAGDITTTGGASIVDDVSKALPQPIPIQSRHTSQLTSTPYI